MLDRTVLNLKIIWSATATIGALWSQLAGGTAAGWAVVAIFGGFNLLWVGYRVVLARTERDLRRRDGMLAPS